MGDSNSVTEVTHVGFVERMMKSVGGALLGLGLFVASFFLLWWNEGNVVAEKEAIAELKNFSRIKVTAPSAENNDKIIHGVGKLRSKTKLGDGIIKQGSYLSLDRTVEMYQWVQHKETKTTKNTGGSETKTTTYSYQKEWKEGRENSSQFKKSGYNNPSLPFESKTYEVNKTSFGKFEGNPVLARIDNHKDLNLEQGMVQDTRFKAEGNYVFLRRGANPNQLSVGDIRVSYKAVANGSIYSIMAKQTSPSTLEPHLAENGKEKFLVEAGKVGPKRMINNAQESAATMANVFRFLGWLVMFMGISMFLAPLSTFLDILPILGSAGRFVTGVFSFLVSAVLSTVTIMVGMIAHNPIALAVVLAGSVFSLYYIYRKGKERQKQQSIGGSSTTSQDSVSGQQHSSENQQIRKVS